MILNKTLSHKCGIVPVSKKSKSFLGNMLKISIPSFCLGGEAFLVEAAMKFHHAKNGQNMYDSQLVGHSYPK